MKKMIVMLVVAAGSLFATNALAVEASGDAYVGLSTVYLWRGANLSQDDAFVVQPGADISIGGFTLGWWGNLSENTGELNEVDLTLDYSFNVTDMVSVSVGNILYDVDTDGGNDTTNELYLGVSVDTLLAPSATIYWDYDEFDSVYATLGASHSFDIQEGLSLSLGATMGYFIDDGADHKGFLNNLEASVSVDYALTDQLTLGAMAMISTPLTDHAENYGYKIGDETSAGVSATFAF